MLGRLILGLWIVPSLLTATNMSIDKAEVDLKNIFNLVDMPSRLSKPAPAYKFRNKQELHAYIRKVARVFALEPKLLKRIVTIESSNCKYKHNKRSNDSGCMQINENTRKRYGFSTAVYKNDMLNVYAAAAILNDFKKAFQKKEPDTWACRYNIGYQQLPLTCQNYLNKLASVQL